MISEELQQNTNVETTLARLKTVRNLAWSDFNPSLPPSGANDWVTFALANSEYQKAYQAAYGQYDEDDTERLATDYYVRRRDNRVLGKAELGTKTDDDRDKGNIRKRVGPAADEQRQVMQERKAGEHGQNEV